MKARTSLLAILGAASASSASAASSSKEAMVSSGNIRGEQEEKKMDMQRFLSEDGDGDEEQDYDDFWQFEYAGSTTAWSDYSIEAKKCMIQNKKHVIAYQMFGKGNNNCAKKRQGTYTMEVGQFAKAYVAQKKVDYGIAGNDFGDDPEALDYVDCTEVEYNGNAYYAKLGCTSNGGLKILSYSDAYCSNEINTNLGLYNDIKISFNTCQSCVTWPSNEVQYDEDGNEVEDENDYDDNFEYYHQFESKLCSAADFYKKSCGWGCKREANKHSSSSSANSYGKKGWTSFEKFFLAFWSIACVGLVWVVLKQRRLMSREDAIVEEAAMNGVGIKKRHIFPIALGIIFFTILAMFMVWKHLTWFLLIGANVGLFAHFVFLRRKARKMSGAAGYVKDGGLQIS